MSERRCRQCATPARDGDTCYAYPYCSDPAHQEPQEGASSVRATQADQAVGAPSCDSPELAAIRVRVGIGMSFGEVYDDRRTLLRMVGELTTERDVWEARADEGADRERALEAERDDLRAKLAEAEKHGRFLVERNRVHFDQAMANGKALLAAEARIKELELIAEQRWKQWAAEQARCEVAEERVNALEEELNRTGLTR